MHVFLLLRMDLPAERFLFRLCCSYKASASILKCCQHCSVGSEKKGLICLVQILTGLTDGQLENLDMIEGDEYVRKTVEVVLTVSIITSLLRRLIS